jgi:dCMP deaminase
VARCSTEKLLGYLPTAREIAAMSKDRSTKVGAIIFGPDDEIRSTGRNGFARKVNDDVPARHERPAKYLWTAHAEENAITQAARSGVSTNGCTLLVTGLHPCAVCSRMMIQAGIKRVLAPSADNVPDRWDDQAKVAVEMLREAGVSLEWYSPMHSSQKEKP